jgi:sulfofructose kinase
MSWSTGILGLGSVAVDDVLFAAYAPPNVKTPIQRRERYFGGQAATALFAAARYGIPCAYAGVLGTDELSASTMRNMRQAGIDLDYLRLDHRAHAVHSVIIVDEDKHTRNIYYHSSPFSGAAIDWPLEEIIQSCQVLLVDQHGMAGMIRAAGIARAANIPIVSDVESNPPGFESLLSLIDHLVISDNFAKSYTGKDRAEQAACALWTPDRAAVVVTCGGDGCWYIGKGMEQPQHFPAFQVPVVDTTGCGDVFHGIYSAGLIEGLDLEERVRLASAAAAIKATQSGGQSGCPTRQTLNKFLNTQQV